MSWTIVIAVALGGAIGSAARFVLVTLVRDLVGPAFPAGTFVVNVVGSFLFGLCWALGGAEWSKTTHALLFVGFFGGFTTFSTFAFECTELWAQDRLAAMALHVIGQNVLAVLGLAAGAMLGRHC